MASRGLQYPGYLNPFGDVEEGEEEEEEDQENPKPSIVVSIDKYPDHLDPFGDDDPNETAPDDYDDSLNPFGDEAEPDQSGDKTEVEAVSDNSPQTTLGAAKESDGNPFADNDDDVHDDTIGADSPSTSGPRSIDVAAQLKSPSPDLIEPPVPLPRTKSLLKKEQAQKKRLQEQQVVNSDLQQPAYSIQSTASSTTSTSSTTTETNPSLATVGSFQRRKRLAPPLPVNFKRQVSGSLDEIEGELNNIGDKLAIIDKESILCQEILTSIGQVEESELKSTKSKYAELIKRRNSIVRRQKELMYKKRELKLDQLHSDIEYELRMIGNKQLSTRTEDDEMREKELLKKLVEIVEEKNDIVENLNKDTSCDSRDVEEAFKRLNITEQPKAENHIFKGSKYKQTTASTITTTGPSSTITTTTTTTKFLPKKESCDKGGLAKLSKIATLLPKSNTMKLKRKRLFKTKDCDSRPPIGR